MATTRRIAVLFHEGDRHLSTQRYIVHHMADFWREDGHEVEFLFGTRRFAAADLVLVHVNLSVVPQQYLEFASRYPRALNVRIRDIRKTSISSNLVRPGDDWSGPVIVKSDLNYAGLPEQTLMRSWLERRSRKVHRLVLALRRLRGMAGPFEGAGDYETYGSLRDVPAARASDPNLVIEKFRPEHVDGLYYTRIYQFLGDRSTCSRMGSRQPIVKASESVSVEAVEPHPDVVRWREELGMDYGKLDYVMDGDSAVLLDANKTIGATVYTGTGAGGGVSHEQVRRNRRWLAEGLYHYL